MELVIDRKTLATALDPVVRVVPNKAVMPLLENVCLETANGDLSLRATALERTAVGHCSPKAATSGSVLVNAIDLSAVVARLPDGDVSIRVSADYRVDVTAGRTRARLPGAPAADFPPFVEVAGHRHDIAAEALRTVLGVAWAADDGRAKPHLAAVHIEAEGKSLLGVATDGHRLAWRRAELEHGGTWTIGLPLDAAGLLVRALNGVTEDVEVTLAARAAAFRVGGLTYLFQLVDGSLPPWRKLIEISRKRIVTRVRLPREALEMAMSRATTTSSAVHDGLVLAVEPGVLRVTGLDPQRGECADEILCDTDGPACVEMVAAKLLTAAAKSFRTDELTVGLGANGALDAITLEADDALAIVMPMRMSEVRRG